MRQELELEQELEMELVYLLKNYGSYEYLQIMNRVKLTRYLCFNKTLLVVDCMNLSDAVELHSMGHLSRTVQQFGIARCILICVQAQGVYRTSI